MRRLTREERAERDEMTRKIWWDYSPMEIDNLGLLPHPLLGNNIMSLKKRAFRIKAKHSEETLKRIHHRIRHENILFTRTPTAIQKRKNYLRRIRIVEIERLLSGQKQLTRKKYSIVPRRAQKAVTHLCYKYNYFRLDDQLTLYYDSETRRLEDRRNGGESYYTKKYGIKFKQADE